MTESLLQAYAYHVWANERVMEYLKTLPTEVFNKELNLGFAAIADVISHLLSADGIWLSRLKEEGAAKSAPKPFLHVEEASESFRLLQRQYADYLASLDDADKQVRYKNSAGEEFQNSVSEIFTHIVNHGTYHRGNITTMLRSLGYKGVATDYIVYVRTK
ncbi:DinB family protein [Cohnella sp. AR92]|uniref:DinB family protein n=1 Tax=Cohnella sp. AR92 TaxID=648716 RepID=UPI000F8D93C8|nr:DinB family protein [Cohnella sp. AR92]RUS47891.1 damage-inducible protein DinB [Cohnella sp. AR92]